MLLYNADILDILDQAEDVQNHLGEWKCNEYYAYNLEDTKVSELIQEKLKHWGKWQF